MEYGVQTVLSLPALFPKINSLEWKDKHYYGREIGTPPKEDFCQVLKEWKNIKSLVDHTDRLNIATHLLGMHQCKRLTTL